MFKFIEETSAETLDRRAVPVKKIYPSVKRKTDKILSFAKDIDMYTQEKEYELLQNTEYDLVRESMLLANMVRSSVVDHGDSAILQKAYDSIINVKVEVEDDVTHIIFSDLLPKKIKNGELRDLGNEINTYAAVLNKELEKCNHFYNEKVVVFFRHIYVKEQEMLDHDNIEIKTVIDTIAVHLLPDDSPKYCAYFMDYEIGEYRHTEIDVIPATKFCV